MKLQALMIAVALVGGTAFAQAPYGSAKTPADKAATMSSTNDASSSTRSAASDADRATMPADKSHGKVAGKHHATHHASAKQHHHHAASAHHHQTHAAADHHHAKHADAGHGMHGKAHHDTRMMGAGASPATDLNASTRQERMDRAYADWQARR